MSDITLIAETTFRNARRKFGIKIDDRRRHVYTVGKTGMGKTAMLENMAIQDIQNGNGIGFVDPHGDAAERLLYFVPQNRINDVVYIIRDSFPQFFKPAVLCCVDYSCDDIVAVSYL